MVMYVCRQTRSATVKLNSLLYPRIHKYVLFFCLTNIRFRPNSYEKKTTTTRLIHFWSFYVIRLSNLRWMIFKKNPNSSFFFIKTRVMLIYRPYTGRLRYDGIRISNAAFANKRPANGSSRNSSFFFIYLKLTMLGHLRMAITTLRLVSLFRVCVLFFFHRIQLKSCRFMQLFEIFLRRFIRATH